MKSLKRFGIDTHNVYNAIRSCRESEHDPDTYRDIIRDALDLGEFANIGVDDDMAEFVARTAIEGAFKYPESNTLEVAIKKAKEHLAKFPNAGVKYSAAPEEEAPKVNDEGVEIKANGKPKKGYKKKRALELWAKHKDEIKDRKDWIELFMAEITDVSRAVANTYVHNLTTGKW